MGDEPPVMAGPRADTAAAALADALARAQLDKLQAEIRKLECEAEAVARHGRGLARAELVKVFGAVLLGAGGVLAAWTQFEVSELKAKAARQELESAEKAKTESLAAVQAASAQFAQARAQAASAQQDLAAARRTKDDVDRAVREAQARRDAAAQEVLALQTRVAALTNEVQRRQAEVAGSREAAQAAQSQLGDQVLQGLAPEAASLASRLIEQAKARGITLRLFAGYRSPQQQAELVATGRSRAALSTHNTGLAFDVVLFEDGKAVFDANRYAAVGEIGKALGLVWGGDYKAFPDAPHFETAGAREALARLRAGPTP